MLRRRASSGTTSPKTVDNLVLEPRNVAFDWTSLPTHWVPGNPFVTHTITCCTCCYQPARSGSSMCSPKPSR
jgi:hypothetical protein